MRKINQKFYYWLAWQWVKDFIRKELSTAYSSALEAAKGALPKAMEEREDYSKLEKDHQYAWNSYRAQALKQINDLQK